MTVSDLDIFSSANRYLELHGEEAITKARDMVRAMKESGDSHEWQTVVIFGRYHELADTTEFYETRMLAHDLLAKTSMWWEPGYVKTLHQGEERLLQPIYFRISISKISGHQGLPAT